MSDCEIDGENIVRKIAGTFTFMWLIAAALMPRCSSKSSSSAALLTPRRGLVPVDSQSVDLLREV